MTSVVRHIKRMKFAVFDQWLNVGFPKFFTQVVPVISFVSGNDL